MKNRDVVAEYCDEWVRWCATRGFYIRKAASGTLGRLQPSKTGREPNARNHPDMQYFNMAVHTLADMKKWKRKHLAFKAYYLGDGALAKQAASMLSISERTYYYHVKSFGIAAYSMSHSIKKAHEAMTAPVLPAPTPALHPVGAFIPPA
ncbi:hypothetical protein [Massilia antarctica]|uniref:hypothetical protein n=1 Tax=Massilia antarctica TaxID=2765360 RepID=UPI00227084E2|nr:hypothetical protein [Massilia sp. H27-R4]MCY0916430.1 hypothetical protein [Massilia sp. H27-R4]